MAKCDIYQYDVKRKLDDILSLNAARPIQNSHARLDSQLPKDHIFHRLYPRFHDDLHVSPYHHHRFFFSFLFTTIIIIIIIIIIFLRGHAEFNVPIASCVVVTSQNFISVSFAWW